MLDNVSGNLFGPNSSGQNGGLNKLDDAKVLEAVIAALAKVRNRNAEELKREIAVHANIPITAKEAMNVCARVEEQCGRPGLVKPSDFSTERTFKPGASNNRCMDPAEDTSLKAITKLLASRI